MFTTLKKKKGIASFVEVTMTAIIFILASACILTTISMLQPQGVGSQKKLAAAQFGKSVLEGLRESVDARTWDDAASNLAVGTHTMTVGNYTVTYDVTDVTGLGVREVNMTVTYPD